MKKFLTLMLWANYCFAGSLTIVGPGMVSTSNDVGEQKTMHQFFQNFTDALKGGLTNSQKSELKGDWKLQITLVHGMTAGPIAEYMEIDLAGGPYKPIQITIPYPSVSRMEPAQLAQSVGKVLWKYMSAGKIENIPNLPPPQSFAIAWPPARRFFYPE